MAPRGKTACYYCFHPKGFSSSLPPSLGENYTRRLVIESVMKGIRADIPIRAIEIELVAAFKHETEICCLFGNLELIDSGLHCAIAHCAAVVE